MMEIILTSILAFTSTNIDDIFLLTLFFGDKRLKNSEIIAGQFLGISTLIAISLLGSMIGLLIEQTYIGLLGFIPIFLGLQAILKLFRKSDDNDKDAEDVARETAPNSVLPVAGVTIANGGDNIGIYVPLFATLTWSNKVTMIAIFLIMTFFWCLIAQYFVKHPYVARTIDKYGHIVTPFVLVLLGIFILYESRTFELWWLK